MKIMNNQAFSKIWIMVILVAIIGGGVLIWNYSGIQNNDNGINEEISENETADWETYRNDKGNYEIKIPKDWKIEEWKEPAPEELEPGISPAPRTAETFFKSPDYQEHWITREETGRKALIYDSGAILDITVTDAGPLPNQCSLPIDYLEKIESGPFVRSVGKEDWKITTYFGCGWRNYNFGMICKPENHSQSEKIFKQILSTFKFIESEDETADWKTYKNKKYEYTMKYPSNLEVFEKEQGGYVEIGLVLINFSIKIKENISSLEELKLLEEEILENTGLSNADLKISWKDKTFLELPAKELSFKGFAGGEPMISRTYVIKDNNAYILSSGNAENFDEYYQMLSTFKFLE